MTIQNYAFNPITITVQAGTTVRWTNLDPDNHTITSVDNLFNSAPFGQNAHWQHTFDTPGTYEYYCAIHGTFMTAWVVVQPVSPSCQVAFTDVLPGSTFYDYVRCLSCRNVLGGYADNTFRPYNNVTRGQLAKIVSNAAGYTGTPTTQSFQDVAPDNTFYVYIERIASHGIISGYTDGTFRPYSNATRGQIAKIVANAAGYTETPSTQTFSDVTSDNTFYVYIERIASRGIINGYTDNTFRPYNNATRGQVAKIVSNSFFPDCNAQ